LGRENKITGRVGEKIAFGFLRRKGYKIITTNYRTPFGEIDAVAKKDDLVVFIEVKTRSSDSLGPPYLAVTGAKARHIIKNALFYLKKYDLLDSSARIDVVSIKLDCEYSAEDIEIIENAVEYNY